MVTTRYLVILCLALGATLMFVIFSMHDWLRQRRPRGDHAVVGAEGQGAGRWYDGTLDRLLVMFPIAAAGLLVGLVLSQTDVDIVDVGAEAMLLASGATATERIVARQRCDGAGEGPAALVVCLVAGLIGGVAGLGA